MGPRDFCHRIRPISSGFAGSLATSHFLPETLPAKYTIALLSMTKNLSNFELTKRTNTTAGNEAEIGQKTTPKTDPLEALDLTAAARQKPPPLGD